MNKIEVVNIKCGGCANSIKLGLEKAGLKNISVDPGCQLVEFEGDEQKAEEILSKMGYPKVGTKKADSLVKRAKSYASCMVGRVKK